MAERKTYKREMAVAVFLFFIITIYTGVDNELVKTLTWPTYTIMALAFGVDWWGKSGGMQQRTPVSSNGRRPERSSEYPARSEEYSDLGDER